MLLQQHDSTVEALSLDHDLEPEHYDRALFAIVDDAGTYESARPPRTGYDVVLWMIEHGQWPATIVLHTMNPVGRLDMQRAIARHAPPTTVLRVVVGFRRGYEHADPTTKEG